MKGNDEVQAELATHNQFLFAIAKTDDGFVDFTVCEEGRASTITLSQPFLKDLIKELSRYVQ